MFIFTYLLEPVTLHAWAINRCDTVHEEFFIQTSYYDVEENTQDADFVIAPNPTNGNLTLHFGDLQGRVEVQVFNSLGQKVDAFVEEEGLNRETHYSMTEFKNGLYYFVINSKGKTLTQKVMLSR